MLNKPTYGSKPIKNEQIGIALKINKLIHEECVNGVPHDIGLKVVQMFDQQPLSDEDIEREASKYAFENNTHRDNNKAFIAGANFAKHPPKK